MVMAEVRQFEMLVHLLINLVVVDQCGSWYHRENVANWLSEHSELENLVDVVTGNLEMMDGSYIKVVYRKKYVST